MSTINLINWFNYGQRKISSYSSIDEYEIIYQKSGINFNYNDGVNTQQDLLTYINAPYLIVTNENNEIESRWFIIHIEKLRGNQHSYFLRRDLISDYRDVFLNSTTYIEKGWISDIKNPLIYNAENFNCNQIKKKEIELKDNIGLKWIVGYLNKESFKPATPTEPVTSLTTFNNAALNYDTSVSSINAWKFNNFRSDYKSYLKDFSIIIDTLDSQSIDQDCYRNNVRHKSISFKKIAPAERNGFIVKSGGEFYRAFDVLDNSTYNWNTIKQRLIVEGQSTFGVTDSLWNEVFAEKGKIIYDQNANKYYKVHLKQINGFSNTKQVTPSIDVDIYTTCSNYVNNQGGYIQQQSNQNFKIIREWSAGVKVELEEVYNEGYQVAIDYDKHIRAVNEAYDVFAIPVLDQEVYFDIVKDVTTGFETWVGFNSQNYNSAFAIGQALTAVSSQALDLQLLPYCPLPKELYAVVSGKPTFYLKTSQNAETWQIINRAGSDLPQNIIFWLSNTEFSNTVSYDDLNDYSTPESIKEINQLTNYRLCSGDYSNVFEFNPAKNGGIPFFEVDVKLRPYTPYIHVVPMFGELYGQDFNDTRGLICNNTNYSISRATDAWENFERTNINYNNAFNREIENMELINEKQLLQQTVGAVTSAIGTGVSTGVVAGAIGSPAIALTAGLTGTIASGIGAVADYNITKELQNEAIDFKKDLFNMSLQNIRALPNTLVASGAQNPNNKVFPLLEIYECSDIEKNAFRNKLKWNGMSINIIDNGISNYIKINDYCYFKGQIIDMDIQEDTHLYNEICNEINKGVFIKI